MKPTINMTHTKLLGILLLSALPVSRGIAVDSNPATALKPQGALTLESATFLVGFDSAKGGFSIRHKPSGRVFTKDGTFEERGGKASLAKVKNKYLGEGNGIEIVYPNGNRDTIGLYEGLPYVVFDSTRHNGTAEPQIINRVPLFSAEVDAGTELSKIKTLGTGGLRSPAENPGSYAFLTFADPATRSGVVGGWLTQDRGSGVVFSPVVNGAVRMQARGDFGHLRIKPGADEGLETFLLGWFDDARLGLENYADQVAKIYQVKLPPKLAGLCTWYMDKNSGACNEIHLPELVSVAARELKPFGFDFIQLDDFWQEGIKGNGPKKNFTTHAPKGPYPSGMKAAEESISKFGLVPGIWFMPFAGNFQDPFFKDHQDWFVKTADGNPYETAWGGTSLDMTNPDAQAFVKSIVQRLAHDWGYKFFKMDGFWTGSATKQVYVNDGYKEDGMGDAVFANPDKTNIEALRDGTKLVREAAGPGVFLLGCAITQNMRSFGGTFGLLDAMRVGPDTNGNIGSPWGSRLWFLNGRVWWNDPDCVYVRTEVSLDRARLNASWTNIADQLFYISDWLPEAPADRLDIVKRCMPAHGLPVRPVDVFESDTAKIWLLTDTRHGLRRDVVGLYNWNKTAGVISESVERIGLPAASEYVGFDFWANKFVSPFREKITATLPPESCRILSVRPMLTVPQLVSTSRHVTQGVVDVTKEAWDGQKAVLSGVSKVVGNDSYELRIVVPADAKSWRVTGMMVSPADEAAGVKAGFVQDGPKIRATLTSATSRDVDWGVQFEPGEVTANPPPSVAQLKVEADFKGVTVSWAPDAADSYRVERIGGPIFETPSHFIKEYLGVEFGTTYQYQVTALGWGGIASASASVEITPKAPEAPPTPPKPTVRLDNITALSVKNGYGKPTASKSISGAALQINGKTYESGIGAHAPALSVYGVPTGASRFVAVVGLDDAVKDDARSSVVFQVFGDVKEMGEKPVLIAESPGLSNKTIRSWAFNLELNSRFKEIRLVVTDAGDGRRADHADWVDAGFICPPTSP